MSIPIKISASRGCSVLGLSKWKTQTEVWIELCEEVFPGFCEKNKYVAPEFDQNAAPLIWGKAFESAIIKLAEEKTDKNIYDREKFFQQDYLTCHIDGRYSTTNILHEGKTTSFFYWKENFGEPGTDKVPIEYQVQCQHQMMCTGADEVILSVLVFPKRVEEFEFEIKKTDAECEYILVDYGAKEILTVDPFKWAKSLDQMGYFHQYTIKKDEELHKKMIDSYSFFWNNNILKQIEPDPKTINDVKCLFTEPIGTLICSEFMENLIAEDNLLKQEQNKLKKRREEIQIHILNDARKSTTILDDDSHDKIILRSKDGKKLRSYNGKVLR